MMRFEEVVGLFADLGSGELTSWVERGWVRPEGDGETLEFREIDVARVRLIRDLRHEMAVGEDAVGLMLPLLDQVYALRAEMRRLALAIGQQPEAVRRAIWDRLNAP